MRLTLRTLLAYLNQSNLNLRATERIESKVRESAAARRLMDDLRRLTSEPSTPVFPADAMDGSRDPNKVAEYLDNALPEADVEDFEKQCFDSTILLAEIASCHEILSGICRGETAAATAAIRQRIYDLGRIPLDRSKLPERTEVKYLSAAPRADSVQSGTPFDLSAEFSKPESVFNLGPPPEESQRPDDGSVALSAEDLSELQRRQFAVRPWVLFLAATGMAVATIWFAADRRQNAKTPGNAAVTLTQQAPRHPSPELSTQTTADQLPDVNSTEQISLPVTVHKPPENDEPERGDDLPRQPDANSAISAPTDSDDTELQLMPPKSATDDSSKPMTNTETPPVWTLRSGFAVSRSAAGDWSLMDPAQEVSPPMILRSVQVLGPTVRTNQLAVQMTPRSEFRVTEDKRDVVIELNFGSISLSAEKPATVSLKVGTRTNRLSLQAGAVVWLNHPAAEGTGSHPSPLVQAYCQQGTVGWSLDDSQHDLGPNDVLEAHADGNIRVGSVPVPPIAEPLDSEPTPLVAELQALDRHLSLSQKLSQLFVHDDIAVRFGALQTQIALDDFSDVWSCLSDPAFRTYWTRMVDDIDLQLQRDPQAMEALQSCLQKSGQQGNELAALLSHRAWGGNGSSSLYRLVEMLEHPDLAIRVAAIERLRRQTGETFLYRPEVDAKDRTKSVVQWQIALRNGELATIETPPQHSLWLAQ